MLNRDDRRYWRWNVDGGGGCATRRVAGRDTVPNTAHAVTDGKKEETYTHASRIHLYDHEMQLALPTRCTCTLIISIYRTPTGFLVIASPPLAYSLAKEFFLSTDDRYLSRHPFQQNCLSGQPARADERDGA